MRINNLLLLVCITAIITGCSSSSNNPISPVKPDSDDPWRDATLFSNPVVTSDNYWNESLIVRDKIWIAHSNPNGSIHYALGPGVDISPTPHEAVAELGNIFLLGPDDFRIDSDETHAGLRIVKLRQYYNGLRVWPSLGMLVYGRGGKLVKAMADVFPIGNLDTTPQVPMSNAVSTAITESGDSNVESSDLVIFGTWETANLAYRIKTTVWIYFIDALTGRVLDREHLVWDAYEGSVKGYASQPNWYEQELLYDFSNVELRVRIDPSEPYPTSYMPLTGIDGMYYFNANEPQLEGELRFFGPWVNLNNNDGYPYNELSIKNDLFDGVPFDWVIDETIALRDERTVFYYSNHSWDYIKDIDPEDTSMEYRLMAYVQNGPWCNAYASGGTINFFKESAECLNLGEIPDVVVHEWGHVHQYGQYGPDLPDSKMREANSDIIANTILDHPYIGWNARYEGDYFRISDNDYKWPFEECNDEPHCLGQLQAGAFWDFREIVGRDYHDYIWHFSKYLLSQTFQDWGADAVIVDDDDDDPLNGSPHYDSIYQCWEINHNLDIPDAVDIPTTGLVIDVVPYDPQIRIPSDVTMKQFNYYLKIMNLDDAVNYTQIWTAVEIPGGYMYGPMIPPSYEKSWPLNVYLEPLQTLEFDLTQDIPVFAPVGEYKYHVRIGEYVDNMNDILTDDARFSFWILN